MIELSPSEVKNLYHAMNFLRQHVETMLASESSGVTWKGKREDLFRWLYMARDLEESLKARLLIAHETSTED